MCLRGEIKWIHHFLSILYRLTHPVIFFVFLYLFFDRYSTLLRGVWHKCWPFFIYTKTWWVLKYMIWSVGRVFKLIEQTFFFMFIRRMKVIIKHLKLPSCLPFYLFFLWEKLWRILKDLITLLISREVFKSN